MMVEPIYLDHIILGQVDDLKRLKTLQSKSAQSGLSAHANKPYKLNSPKLILWRDDCLSAYKSIRILTQAQPTTTTTLANNDQDGNDQDEAYDSRHVNSLNWTYHDHVSDHAAELLDAMTGTVKLPYITRRDLIEEDGSCSDLSEIAAGSRLSKAKMMAQLIRIMMSHDSLSSCLLFEGHNGGKFFDNMESTNRVTYRALKNLAYQYNYVKYLCSPIFMNDLRVAAGGVDWVSSFDKVKNYEDQISFKVAPMNRHLPTSMAMMMQLKQEETNEHQGHEHEYEQQHHHHQDNMAYIELPPLPPPPPPPTTTDVSDGTTTTNEAPSLNEVAFTTVSVSVSTSATSAIGTDKMNDEQQQQPVMAKEHQPVAEIAISSSFHDDEDGDGHLDEMTCSLKGQQQQLDHLGRRQNEDGDRGRGDDEEGKQRSAFVSSSNSSSSFAVASSSAPNIVLEDKLPKLPDNYSPATNLSTPSSLISQQSAPPTPTPSEVSSTKSKSKSKTKALLKKWRPGKRKKKTEPSSTP